MEFKDFKQRLDELSRTLPSLYRDEYIYPEKLADDPVFANCNIMLERKQ